MEKNTERLKSILGAMLNIQSNVSCSIVFRNEWAHGIEVSWFDSSNELLAYIRITDFVDDYQFGYFIKGFEVKDVYDARLHSILVIYSDYTSEIGYNFRFFEEIIKALTVFTSYLIKELN